MWKPVPEFEARYEVSDRGEVRSLRTGKPIVPVLHRQGHFQVGLYAEGKRHYRYVHRLVAESFLGEPTAEIVRHLDGDPSNNGLANLAYGSQSDNMIDSIGHGTHVQSRKTHCPRGHEYDTLNTYLSKAGKRHCKRCLVDRKRERRVAASMTRRESS